MSITKQIVNPLVGDFPVISEHGEPKAVIVDIKVFRQLQIVLDNLLNRDAEPEDAVLAASGSLHKLLSAARETRKKCVGNWREQLA